jgi:hypothetical protein
MWRREFFENIKWNPGQPNQKWRSNAVSAGHVRSKTELLQADKWFVFTTIRILADLRSAEGAKSLVAWGNAPRTLAVAYFIGIPWGAAPGLK